MCAPHTAQGPKSQAAHPFCFRPGHAIIGVGERGVSILTRVATETRRGVGAAVRARPGTLLGGAAALFALSILLPPLVLSLFRKPVDYFTFNPWLRRLPEYVADPDVALGVKLEKLWDLALFWFSSDSPMGGTEWGFAVGVGDLVRIALTSLLFGLYVALWRVGPGAPGRSAGVGRQSGPLGALIGMVGLSTGPCSVMGCGAPVLPVVGLAFVGLSSGTIALLSTLSSVMAVGLPAAMALGVVYLGWLSGRRDAPAARPRDRLRPRW